MSFFFIDQDSMSWLCKRLYKMSLLLINNLSSQYVFKCLNQRNCTNINDWFHTSNVKALKFCILQLFCKDTHWETPQIWPTKSILMCTVQCNTINIWR